MNRLGFKTLVYHGDVYLGELDTVPVKDGNFQFPNNEIRIHTISPKSERCHPLSVLQTISSASVRCKLEPNANTNSNPNPEHLINLHASCFYELKTAVVLLGNDEVHLVAMPSKQKKFPCFWCYSVPSGLYSSCLWMLNTRCLAIVFDLDETLIVANTMKSFEDRIESLRDWIERETDPIRESGIVAQMKRYVEDRVLLKQYAETDCVVDGGKVYNVQHEEVPQLSDGIERVVRPVVRLPEQNVVLTRINPEVFFTGEKIGVGMGRTRKDAQQQAAENALRGLADEPKTVNVRFKLRKECAFGQQFLIVGDDPVFGLWDPADAIPLNWSDGHVWSVKLQHHSAEEYR
ncbi:unnamed protein product [Fraxinus pennsylvanica]|uniref:CBM20 domain-containing protein n=1 Tax=Fraxinus pennsylvanica TaxID=56036 RepID=A0AAD2E856_9LAMI|nr:unnamed protein product [Fraxinus pennsylvanica]